MQKTAFIFLFFLQVFTKMQAQERFELTGSVTDSVGSALSGATVRLVIARDTQTALTATDGSFHFRVPFKGSFGLQVTMKGFGSFEKVYIVKDRSLTLPVIMLYPAYGELAPVTVLQIKPVTVRGDTVEFNTGAYAMRAGAELERLLKRLPGVEVDADGSIYADGNKIARILLNGSTLSGVDMASTIRNLPADIVDKVQVIDDYGDKARLTGVKSGESVKVLNIVLKKDKQNGFLGNVEAGAGDKGKYGVGLFSDAFSKGHQLTLNGLVSNNSPAGNIYEKDGYLGYSGPLSKTWLSNGSLSYAASDHYLGSSQIQDNIFDSSTIHQEQSNQVSGHNRDTKAGWMFTYTPDAYSALRITPNLDISRGQESTSNQFSSIQQGNFTKNTIGNSLNQTNAYTLSAGSEVYFQKIYPASNRRLSFHAVYQYSNRQNKADNLTNTDIRVDSLHNFSAQHYIIQTTNPTQDWNANLNYYVPLRDADLLELGYAGHYSLTQNNRITWEPDNSPGSEEMIDSLSNNYRFLTMTQRFHIGYLTHSKKMNLSVGLDAQPGSQTGQAGAKETEQTYRYFNLLPMMQLSYALSPLRKFNLAYSSNSLPPSLQQLQPVTDLSNPQYPVEGNPYLKPAYSQSAILHYQQSSMRPGKYPGFALGLTYNSTQNMIVSNLVHPKDTSSVVEKTTFLNANGFYSFIGNYQLVSPAFLHKQLRINLEGNLGTSHAVAFTDNVSYNTSTLTWSQKLKIDLNIPNVTESSLAGTYTHTLTRYTPGSSSSSSFSTFTWSFYSLHYLFQKWAIRYNISQAFTSRIDGSLQTNPAILNVSIQREFFRNNRASLSFSANNLLNSNTGVSQTVTPTSFTQSRTLLLGQYFLLSFKLKLQKFR